MGRQARHPEAVAVERAGLAPESTLLRKGWRPDYGWFVVFYKYDGARTTRDYPPGTERELVTEETRLTLRENPKVFEKAWIHMKNGKRERR
jgi:hypothetical protein